MWSISYGFGDDAKALPQTTRIDFAFATDLLAHLDRVRSDGVGEIPLEGHPGFSLSAVHSVEIGHLATDDPTREGPAPYLYLYAQVGNASPPDLAEVLIHAIGRKIQPNAGWAAEPPPPRELRMPETSPLPEGQWGMWMIEWPGKGTPAHGQDSAWAKGGAAFGDGVLPTREWVERSLAPIFSPTGPRSGEWFKTEVAGRRPGQPVSA